jgi:rhodanese-related sulfurtransferase
MKRLVLQSVLLLCWSALTAVGWNLVSPWGIPLTRGGVFDIEAAEGGWRKISILDAWDLYQNGAIFIDARPIWEFKEGTIEQAYPLPVDDFEAYYPRFEMLYPPPPMGADLPPTGLDHVTFCTGGACTDSVLVARWLTERNHQRVWVMEEGYETWLEQGYPVGDPYGPATWLPDFFLTEEGF